MQITFYAGAADAARMTTRTLDAGPLAPAELLRVLGGSDAHLDAVLRQCSLLVDGVAVDADAVIGTDARVDVLPPFAGG